MAGAGRKNMKMNVVLLSGIITAAGLSLCLWVTGHLVFAGEQNNTPQHAELVWSESDGLRHEIYASNYHAGQWSEPYQITDDNADNLHPAVDTDADGRKWVVWTAIEETGYEIKYTIFEHGEWREPKVLPSSLRSNIKPSVALDDKNIPWVVWTGNDGGNDEIYFSRFIDGKWEKEGRVHKKNEVPDILPVINLDTSGELTVSWEGYRNGAYRHLQSTWTGKVWRVPVEPAEENEFSAQADKQEKTLPLPEYVKDQRQAFLRIYEK